MTEILHHFMRELIEYSIILLELIGVLVLLAGALRATVNYIKGDPHPRVKLCREEKDQAEEQLEECTVEVLDKEKREKVASRWRSIKEVI